MTRHALRAAVLGLVFLAGGCLEGFESLITRVRYDPYAQSFEVERVLVGVGPAFFACGAADECADVIDRVVHLAPRADAPSIADRLLGGLLEEGAEDLSVALARTGDRLDLLVRYRAKVGTGAADDTSVRVEWNGKGDRGRYGLVVEAQPSMDRPRRSKSRKTVHAGAAGPEWTEEWVLPRRDRSVETHLAVGPSVLLFAAVPDLDMALATRGLLAPAPAPAASIR